MEGAGRGNQLSRYGAIATALSRVAPSAKVFFVLSSTPSWFGAFQKEFGFDKEGTGRTYSTVAAALSNCVAGRGDVILVMPNHTESITAATTWTTVAGVSIIGLGDGDNRPTFSFTTATTAKIAASNNNCVENVIFSCGLASVATALDFSGTSGGVVRNCSFYASAASKCFLISILTNATTTDLLVENNIAAYNNVTSNSPTEFIRLIGATNVTIRQNYLGGPFSTAAINNITTACVDLQVYDNEISAGGLDLAFLATTTGTLLNTKGQPGAEMLIQKTITSSTITTSAQDLSTVAVNGDFYIDNVILETDTTGLAGATNFRILKNGGEGLAAIIEETVANLGANKSVDLFTASVVKQRCTLKKGQKLQFLGTVGAGTGAGQVKVTVVMYPVRNSGYVNNV